MSRLLFVRILLPGAVWYAMLVGIGLLLAHPLGPELGAEDTVNHYFAEHRSPGWNAVTGVMSTALNTPVAIATLVVVVLVLRWTCHAWWEAATLVVAVLLQVGVFLLTAMVIDRPRPEVPHLDAAPPTSSFPSGHTGAATALYLTLALIITWRLRRPVPRVLIVLALALIPVAVGAARLYRGMHHPTDVAFGMVNGMVCMLIAAHAFRPYARAAMNRARIPLPRGVEPVDAGLGDAGLVDGPGGRRLAHERVLDEVEGWSQQPQVGGGRRAGTGPPVHQADR
jgi:membrane-associated phospholipid phosphatase